MRIGQTSSIVFGAKLLTSVVGFVATLYFARVLGAEVLGYYALALVVANWLKLVGDAGISSAVKKRVSEETDPSAYFTAGLIMIGGFGLVASVLIAVFRDTLNSYVGADVAPYIIIILLVGLAVSITNAGLEGKRLVHVTGMLSPVLTGGRSLIQIVLVLAGFGLTGMLLGFATGGLLVLVIGIVILSVRIRRPTVTQFRSLFDYAKFSWLGNLRGRSFNDIDIIVLGAFVSPTLVGIYSITWNLTSFVGVFASSIRQTLFPELSYANAQKQDELFQTLITDSIAFTGLIAIPGLFGSILIGDRLLRIYGDEFTRGTVVLGLLILSMLIYDYQAQLLNALNSLDRPDISFRVNFIFVGANLAMNVMFVRSFGWVGAAVATVVAATIGLVLSLYYLRSLVRFELPEGEIGNQLAAAVVMGLVVGGTRAGVESAFSSIHNMTFVVGLVALGAGVYFVTLLSISTKFRTTIQDNTPITLPSVFQY
ncbi:oligosaccharide flippase family protein [Halonotius pteroides]|uniref:Transporter n=1 Tax=Halonotius pteroides TaxID=268735 RepID=A0A3A6Q7P4_9EURY|nr:oligosaccharide flippase family protein [Halonotius pteroides]RJX47510.1 transporter [Halonotius pteroides]